MPNLTYPEDAHSEKEGPHQRVRPWEGEGGWGRGLYALGGDAVRDGDTFLHAHLGLVEQGAGVGQ